jgi:hypothetical protein
MWHSGQEKLLIAAPGIPVDLFQIHHVRECGIDNLINAFHATTGLGLISGSLLVLDTKAL